MEKTLSFWQEFLGVSNDRFYKTMIKERAGTGIYKQVVEYGVLTVYFNNTKLRNLIISQLNKIKVMDL